jgi:hypothetical protein
MSRTQHPGAPAGGPPPRQHGLEGEAAQPSWPPPQQAPQGWPPPQPSRQPDPYAAGYHYPQGAVAHSDTYATPPPPPPRAPAAPQYDPYQQAPLPQQAPQSPQMQAFQAARPTPPPQPRAPSEFAPPPHPGAAAPGYPPMTVEPRTAPPRQQPQMPPRAPAADLRGTIADQWPTQTQPARGMAPAADPRAADPRQYDLGAYAAAPQQPAHAYAPQQTRGGWPTAGAALADPPGAAPTFAQAAPQGRAVVTEPEYAHDEAYDDEPPRRSRGIVIVGALVGAITLGGGLAYAYKVFMVPSTSGKTPVVRADQSPTKTAPAVAGGRQFANQDMKVPGRVTDSAASASSGEDGTRRVSTVMIGRDGSTMAPQPVEAPPGVSVARSDPMRVAPSGITPPVLPPPQRPGATAMVPPPPPAAPATEPRTLSLKAPGTTAAPAPAEPTPAARIPVQPKVAQTPRQAAPPPVQAEEAPAQVPKKPSVRAAAAAPPAGAGAPKASGYVAVLSSQRSSMDALKAFADLQQKYPSLQGRSPSVVEANIPDKGVFHRLVVGPPGPRDQATALCSELKAAGYQGCWVTAQ